MIDYYSKRAREYERIYDKPERQEDIARLREHLCQALTGRRVLELACGTGFWTAAIADSVRSIHATDEIEVTMFDYFWCVSYQTKEHAHQIRPSA